MNKSKKPLSIFKPGIYPPENLPEIVLCGRSNSGKSTLINALLNKKKLAHTSSKPGKTCSINFYPLDDKIMLVDLPGYGYAKVPFKVKQEWKELIEGFLENRSCIASSFILCDIRRSLQEDDIALCKWFVERKIPVNFIFTKTDKLSNNEFNKQKSQVLAQVDNLWQDSYQEQELGLFFVSALKKTGISELLNEMRASIKK
jgi:GTP-binding protein